MALKKGAAAPPARNSAVKATATRPAAEPRSPSGGGAGDSTRLLREAAWSRMFGRVESKNPFTR
jgi:hypothetical protein